MPIKNFLFLFCTCCQCLIMLWAWKIFCKAAVQQIVFGSRPITKFVWYSFHLRDTIHYERANAYRMLFFAAFSWFVGSSYRMSESTQLVFQVVTVFWRSRYGQRAKTHKLWQDSLLILPRLLSTQLALKIELHLNERSSGIHKSSALMASYTNRFYPFQTIQLFVLLEKRFSIYLGLYN